MLVGAVDFSSIVINTSELGIVEPKVFSTATLENDFADNHVLVVLNNKSSLNFKTYSTSDFKEVKCSAVNDLTSGKKKQVETKVSNFKNPVSTMSAEGKAAAIEEINKYNQIICLELADKGKENVLAAIKALQSRDDVMYAGPDYVMTLCSTTPNDTFQSTQWALTSLNLREAWDVTSGSSSVVVGVIDTGVDVSHPDLQGQIITNKCADFSQSYVQYIVPEDYQGHGTHVAGIIAATMNNDRGIAGAASGVRIASLRVYKSDGKALASRVALAINYAESNGIKILNWSGGIAPGASEYDYALDAIIDNYSGLLVCSAGNSNCNIDIDDNRVYPASFTSTNVLVVGASTPQKQRKSSSNYGATSVDVFAPGENILSCFPIAKCTGGYYCYTDGGGSCEGYHTMGGTSMAAPYVAGTAALMLSENPNLTPQQIKDRIIATCVDYSAFNNLCVSDGIVNACHAVLNAYSPTTASVNSSRTFSIATGQEYWIKVTIPSSGVYSFVTSGSLHTVGELFHYTDGRLELSSNAESTTSSNFLIEENLETGAIVYLRITVKGTPSYGSFTLWVG